MSSQERKREDEIVASEARALRDAHIAENERRDEFLAMLGHELRNPLAAIAHGLDLLGFTLAEPTKAEEIRGMLVRQTARMQRLLDELLDMARVVSGNIVLREAAIDLGDVVHAALETVTPLIARHRHEVTVIVPPPGTARVRGDATRLAQVVENLVTNAAKYTDPGGHLIVAVDVDDGEARIRVKDTGRGIAAAELPFIFDVFMQGKRPLDRAQGGLGLGLPLVRRLAEMHGGTVQARSSGPGQGTTMTVTLPLLAEEAQATPTAVRTRAVAGNRRRVLVVDDEEDNATLFARVLEAQGHDVRAVNDGPAALTALATFRPEVVFLDLGLPGMNGYEVAKKMRGTEPGAPVTLVALTGYQRDQAQLDAAGFDEHLIKPPDLDVLSRILEAAPALAA